jgi:WD40 repeat protein
MSRASKVMVVVLGMGLAASLAQARSPRWGGLEAVDISPDGKTIVVGGQNRVIYVVDAESLEVLKRHWAKARVGTLRYTGDGKVLLVEDEEGTVHLHDAGSMLTDDPKVTKQIQEAEDIECQPKADLFAAIGGDWKTKEVTVYTMSEGSEKMKVTLPEKVKPAGMAISPDGKKLAILTDAQDTDTEKKLGYGDIPKDLKNLAKDEFRQKNDGKISHLMIYDIPSGKELKKVDLWYTSSAGSTDLVFDGDKIIVFNYSNLNAVISPDGSVELFKTKSMGYGRGVKADNTAFAIGSLRDATLVLVEGMVQKTINLDSLPGWPEYFGCFAFAEDGTCYGVTSASRLVKIDKDGNIEKTVPIY